MMFDPSAEAIRTAQYDGGFGHLVPFDWVHLGGGEHPDDPHRFSDTRSLSMIGVHDRWTRGARLTAREALRSFVREQPGAYSISEEDEGGLRDLVVHTVLAWSRERQTWLEAALILGEPPEQRALIYMVTGDHDEGSRGLDLVLATCAWSFARQLEESHA